MSVPLRETRLVHFAKAERFQNVTDSLLQADKDLGNVIPASAGSYTPLIVSYCICSPLSLTGDLTLKLESKRPAYGFRNMGYFKLRLAAPILVVFSFRLDSKHFTTYHVPI